MSELVRKYLRARYGGNVAALKPPLGYNQQYVPRSLRYRLAYHLWQYPRWRVDCLLFRLVGEPMRQAWRENLTK